MYVREYVKKETLANQKDVPDCTASAHYSGLVQDAFYRAPHSTEVMRP